MRRVRGLVKGQLMSCFLGRPFPLGVGSRPRGVVQRRNTPCRKPASVRSSCYTRMKFKSRLRSLPGHAIGIGVQVHIGSPCIGAAQAPQVQSVRPFGKTHTAQVPLAALRRTAAPKSAPKVQAPANTPAPSSVGALRLPEFIMHPAQASNPSIERTSQRPLRALWSAAHVER